MVERPHTATLAPVPELAWGAAALAAAITVAWAAPTATAWLHDGTVIAPFAAIKGTVALVSDHAWSHPANAYPRPLRMHMPAGSVWWAGAGWALGTLLAAAIGAWRALDAVTGQHRLGRRAGSVRGARPRAWAQGRDLPELVVRRAQPGRFTLGRLDGNVLASDPESHVAVVAPTRSGKTSRCVIPWLLEHDGPAIVTSTKTDVLQATRGWRARQGRVTAWDPFGPSSDAWTPLSGCTDWQHALAQAQWLGDAAQEGDSEVANFWRGEAARLLAPLLHAAALADGVMAHVLAWVDSQDVKGPAEILDTCGATAARYQLGGIAALDPRNRGTIYMSAGSLLAAYRLPCVQATAHSGLTPDDFLDGAANTLYLIASSRQQRLLAPLTVAILSGLLHAAAERADRHGPLRPTLRVLLDETANIAPLRDLPALLSQVAGHGVRVATVWQSLAQTQHHYGLACDEILANSTTKLYLGPVTDATTRRHITELLGDEPVDQASVSTDTHRRSQTTSRTWRAKASAPALQQLELDRALLVAGRRAPAIITTTPWWAIRRLGRRGSRSARQRRR
ncbi:MAG: type secretion system protein VirD4 [Thermoleophilaceae bacterium]|nr:type secretion system protein VirD4 [Thermoleophilaceae bacterium]